MSRFFQKTIICLLGFLLLTSPFLQILEIKAEEYTEDPSTGIDWINDSDTGDMNYGDSWEPTPEDIILYQNQIPIPIIEINTALNVTPTDVTSYGSTDTSNPLTAAFENTFINSKAKIEFTPTDAEDVRELLCLNTTIPDFASDPLAIMSVRKDLTPDDIKNMKANHPDTFNALVSELKQDHAANLSSALLSPENRSQLQCILRAESIQEVENEIKNDLDMVKYRVSQAIDSLKIDVRILKMLNYLVTPKNRGGAGHELIKVYRLRKGYDTPNRLIDRESEAIIEAKNKADSTSSEDTESDETVGEANETLAQSAATSSGQVVDTNDGKETISDFAVAIDDSENQVISAHANGQAVDIEAVDNIKCTLIQKRRVGGSKKTLQPPKPIELIWQTDEGYGKSAEGQRDSVSNMVNALYRDGLIDLLSQFDIDINNMDDLSTANLGDVLDVVGNALIGQLINTNGSITGSDLKDTLRKVGAVYLADKLDLPRAALYGAGYSNLDDLKANLGRAQLEDKLGMPFGSLIGEKPSDIYYSIGERKMEYQMNLPIATLTPDIKTEKQLLVKIGASLLETKLHFTRGSFLQPSFDKIREAAGGRKFDIIFSMPQVIDTRLGITDGTSAKFTNKQLSPAEYLYEIAAKHLADNIYTWTKFENSTCTGSGRSGLVNCTSESGKNRWNSIFNLPSTADGSSPLMTDLITGQVTALTAIGQDELAKKLSKRDEERTYLKQWLSSANSQTSCPGPSPMSGQIFDENADADSTPTFVTIDEKYLNSNLGLGEGDFYQIFGCSLGGSGAVFAHIGGKRLYEAVKNSPEALDEKNQFLAEHPEILQLIQEVDFYKTRVDDIKKHLDILDGLMGNLKNDPETKETYQTYTNIRDKVRNHSGTSVKAYTELAKEAKTQFGILRTKAATSDKFKTIINSSLSEIDAIFFDIEEIITGEDNGRLSDFRFSELTINDTGSTGTATSHSNMNPRRAVWLLLTGKASIKDVIVYLGGGMVEDNLNLPPNTFIYYIKSLEQANQDKPEQVNAWDGSDHINYDIGDGSTATFESSYFNSLGGSTADQTNKKYERERFMASLGQAAIEEQMALLPNSFQGTSAPDPGKNETISDVIGNMASASGSSASKAKSALQSGFGTSASLDRLISGDTSAWSQARQSFVSFDSRLNLKSGSTEAFITGINKHMTASAYLSQEEIDLISGRLDIPESALIKLTKVLAGEESWEVNPLNFNNFNPYDQTGSLVDDSGNCIATTDGNIIYTDLDGKHTFTTQEQALNYFNDHRDRQLDYIGQIAKAFAKISGATNLGEVMFTALLKAYLSDFDNPRALSDQQIAIFAESGGISSEILSRLFVREDKKSSLFKYLVSVGEKVSELRLRYLLLDNFGVNVGGMKLTGNDLFDLLNGGGSTTLYRIAGNYMDTELGLNSGTFAKILSAPNSQVRQCLLQQAGASLIFNRLGISGLQLYGNPYHALGSSKIETVLGFPRGSFDSDSPNNNEDKRTGMIELINKVGVNAFVKAFKIPLAGLDFRPIAKQLFPLDKEADLDKLTNNQILDRLDLLLSSASLEDTNIFTARKQLTDKVVNRLQFIIDPNSVIWQYKEENGAQTAGGALRLNDFVLYESSPVWGSVAQGMVFKKEILAFQKQVAYLDFAVGIPSGRTQALLQGTITPDSYRDYISQTQATILGAGKIAEMLGIDPAKFQAVSAIYDKFRTTGNLWNDWKPEDQLLFYKAFMTVFELNLDELAGFRANTFESIILQPDNARNILLKEGLYRLDQSVFGSDSGFSTEAIFAAYLGEDGNGVYKQCNISTSSINSSLGLNGLMAKCQPVKVSGKEGGIYAASYQMANYLEKLACPDGTSGACWLRSGNTSIANVSDLLSDFLRSGDVDVLEALANASLASKINNLLNDTVALPLNFQVTWQDIVGAIYGNRDLEGVAADRAAYQALLDMNNPTATADSEPVDSYERNNGFGVTGQLNIGDPDHPYSGFVSQTSNPDDIGQMVAYNINSAYPNFDQNAYNTMVSQLESSKPQLSGSYIDAHGNPNESYFFAYDAWSRKKQAIEDAKSQARDQVRRSYQKNLEYHYFDSILYQKDKNIPPGFTAAIFEGNSHTRANALYAWVRNGIIQGGFLGLTIDAELQPLLTYMVDDAQWGNTIAFENFVKSGQIGKLDDLLRTRFDEALGVSLAPGTFTAIIAGWRNNGNFKNDYTFIGSDGKTNYTLPSLETVYKKEFASRISEWFDKQLGLSAGTSYSIYKSYKSYEAARHAFQSASVASGYLDDALAEAKRTLSGLEPGTPAATTAQENVNKLQAESDKAKTNLSSKQTQMVQMKAELISFVISTLFAKQLAALEESLGLVPGSGAMLVSMAVNWYFGLGIGPWAIGMFIVLNLFGYYKTELLCTADGYYPGAETPSSSDIVDNGGLGVFDGMNSNTKKAEYVKAAQYKARTLLGDVLSMPRVFNDQRMTPSQIMTGRKEDVDYWYPKTLDVIYQYTGAPDENGEIPSRAGLWQNPQTTAYTHIGF